MVGLWYNRLGTGMALEMRPDAWGATASNLKCVRMLAHLKIQRSLGWEKVLLLADDGRNHPKREGIQIIRIKPPCFVQV